MLSLDGWQALGIVCGSLLALYAVLGLAVKAVRRMFSVLRKASEFFDQVLGDKERNMPSMMDVLQDTRAKLDEIERAQAEHMERYHGQGPVPVASPFRGRRTR